MTNQNFRFTKKHEWVLPLNENRARIGITDHAQQELGDIVFFENGEIGDQLAAEDSIGVIESVKAASEVYSPLTGKIVKVNENLEDEPELINNDPLESGWLLEIEYSHPEELENLLSEADYQSFINEGEE
ncbi:glycine cleavage system H protein [Natronobacillus azotifigens]|uniref:Glycine cleavage system H protein n=1 Tax=Natronobacillus azotifigens TaxID=472978 RepID=A0A9J6RDE9_9BACI|nr:glycine cleavage system protein GcvH [Natronobacillus azotifigens]MCZ0703704.1 glycine cleavage system protein GcvH [Natronobacillus azotifigens]